MALNFVPGVDVVTIPISTAAGVARNRLGEEGYAAARGVGTYTWAAANAFLPINPAIIPAQIGFMIALSLIFIFVFGCGVGRGILYAWLTQGVLLMFAAQWITDRLLKYGFGV